VILARDRRYATNVPAIKVPCRWICTQSEMTLTVPGFVRCSGPKSKKGEMNAVFDATCNRIDADGDAVDKPCKLTGPFELHKRGDDEYELLAASITVVDEKKCEFSWLIKVGEKDPNTQLGSTKMKKK
jgi:hypothetical protein